MRQSHPCGVTQLPLQLPLARGYRFSSCRCFCRCLLQDSSCGGLGSWAEPQQFHCAFCKPGWGELPLPSAAGDQAGPGVPGEATQPSKEGTSAHTQDHSAQRCGNFRGPHQLGETSACS